MDAIPGDIVFFHGTGLVSWFIRAGEWLRGRNRLDAYWNHVAVVVDSDHTNLPRIVQAEGQGVAYAYLKDIDVHYHVVSAESFPLIAKGIERQAIVAQAHALVGAKYGWLTIVSIILNLVTPKWVRFPDFRRGSTYICSAAAAWCLHAGGALIDTYDIYQIFPSELRHLAA